MSDHHPQHYHPQQQHPPGDFSEIAIPALTISVCTLFMMLCFFAPPVEKSQASDSETGPVLSTLGEWPFDPPVYRPESPRDALRRLDGILGDWRLNSEQETFRWSIHPAVCGNYLVFTEERTLSATGQKSGLLRIIAFDPVSEIYDVSLFGTDGRFGSGLLTVVGGNLLLTSRILLPNGAVATETEIFTPSAHELLWRVRNQTLGGEPLPDLGPIKAVRIDPFPNEAPVLL